MPAQMLIDGGVIVIEVEVMGAPMSVLLDTGVSCSLAADRLVRAWQAADPDLPSSAAAVGPGNMAGLPVEARTPMVRVPLVAWGDFSVPGVAFAWRGDGDVAPYDGSLGGNVLRFFRIGLDHGRDELWVEQRAAVEVGGDADQVGVTLVLTDDFEWMVGAVVLGLTAVQVGDRLARHRRRARRRPDARRRARRPWRRRGRDPPPHPAPGRRGARSRRPGRPPALTSWRGWCG